MFNILIDTSVWLDLAEDQRQTPLLSVVEALIKDGSMQLIVSSIVIAIAGWPYKSLLDSVISLAPEMFLLMMCIGGSIAVGKSFVMCRK
jgi:hypothetical protein